MSIALPLIGVLLAALVVFFSSREPVEGSSSPPRSWLPLVGVAVLVALLLGLASVYGPEVDRPWIAAGLVIGVLAAIPLGSIRASACVGLAAGICAHLVPSHGVPACQLALIAGAGLAALLTGSYSAAAAATAVVALDRFGALSNASENLPFSGSAIAVAVLIAALLQSQVKKLELQSAVAVVVPLLAFIGLNFWLKDQALAATGSLGVIGAAILAFLVPAEGIAKPASAGVGALISVGLATAAFALDRGTGMAAAFLGAAGVLLLLGNARALLALGPLFALVLFRLFQNIYPDTSRAFDIGQHYALIGLIIGAIVPLILIDATDLAKPAKAKGTLALGLLALIVIALVPILTVFLGPTGAAGFVVGLGFAALFELVRQGSSLLALSAGSGMAGVMLVSYGWLSASLDLTRDEKIRMLAWSVGGILALSLLAVLLLRSEPLKEKE